MTRALVISLEGSDGAGKGTQLQAIQQWLDERGFSYRTFREPGGSRISEQIRAVLLAPENTAMTGDTELLLYTASRLQLIHECLLPLLPVLDVLLLDRYNDSTTAYQGFGRRLERETVENCRRLVRRHLWPDRTYWLDLDPDMGLRRVEMRDEGIRDRLEQEELSFFQRVREGYQYLAAEEPGRILRVDAELPPAEVSGLILKDLEGCLNAGGRKVPRSTP